MDIYMEGLALKSLYAIILGIFLGTVYDAVRIFRAVFGISSYGNKKCFGKVYSKGVKNIFDFRKRRIFSDLFVAAGDIFFFAFAAVSFILFLYWFNYGMFRWFFLLFCIIGFVISYHSIGRFTVFVAHYVSEFIRFVINIVLFAFMFPFVKSACLLKKVFIKNISPLFVKSFVAIDNSRNKRYTVKCIGKIEKIVNSRM